MQLSKRLLAVAEMVTFGSRLADVGTDHGYIPLYLLQQKRIAGAIAMDVNQGPLERAQHNICEHAAAPYIETRLSDGISQLQKGEADAVVIAGMGGSLIIRILSEGAEKLETVEELILQPQSDIPKVREFLTQHGFQIVCEDMVWEDGKYYVIMKAVHGQQEQDELSRCYGGYLLAHRHPVLKQYLDQKRKKQLVIQEQIRVAGSDASEKRIQELEEELGRIDAALKYYEM